MIKPPPHCLPFDPRMECLLAEYRAGNSTKRRSLNRRARALLAELQAKYVATHGRDASGDYRSLRGVVREHIRTGSIWITVFGPTEAAQCIDCHWIGATKRWTRTSGGWRCSRCQQRRGDET